MKRYFLFPFVAFTLLQLAGIAATPPQKKKANRASKKLPYKAKVPGVDPTLGDNVDGDDLVDPPRRRRCPGHLRRQRGRGGPFQRPHSHDGEPEAGAQDAASFRVPPSSW